MIGCQHAPLSVENLKFPLSLQLKGRKSRSDVVDFHTESAVKTTSTDKISRNNIEVTDFTIKSETLSYQPKKNRLVQVLTATKKEGEMSLHEMAFPEVGEELEVAYRLDGKIVSAGDFSREGIFYVPRISLPEHPVRVGDRWKMQAQWVSDKNQIKMHLDLVSIFKRAIPCGRDVCADLEVSGEVTLPGLNSNEIQLKSSLNGRILFAIGEGVEVWSEVRNYESMILEGLKVSVESCLESVLREPEEIALSEDFMPDCKVPLNDPIVMPL